MPDELRDNAILVLEIGYYDAADARTSGTAIERLANAFAQETRAGQSRHGLELVRVEIGSLHAWFDLGKTLLDLYDQRALFGAFLQGVAVALEAVMNAGGGSVAQISASVRTFLVSLAAPIVRKQASHARLYVKGDNNTIIYIENLQAERIDQLFDAPRRVRGGGGFALSDRADAEIVRSRREVAADPARGMAGKRIADAVESRVPSADGFEATLLHIGGQWYARPVGLQGVMLPTAEGGIGLGALFESETYQASGTVLNSSGLPSGFLVRRVILK